VFARNASAGSVITGSHQSGAASVGGLYTRQLKQFIVVNFSAIKSSDTSSNTQDPRGFQSPAAFQTPLSVPEALRTSTDISFHDTKRNAVKSLSQFRSPK
jgi:hypothetical protein